MMKTILVLLLTCVAAMAQQTVNNFTVKTNLVLRGANVSSLLTPVAPNLSTNWFTISTWGDSLTQGSGATTSGNAYPAVLQAQTGFDVLNGGVPGETSTQIKTRFDAATSQHNNATIIWSGRNNYSFSSVVLSDIASMVATLEAAGNTNYLVLSILNGDYVPGEAIGGVGYQVITNINATLAASYPGHYLDVRTFLVGLYDPMIPQDVIDHGYDIPPSSLRSDAIHLNDAGYAAVANHIATNGWTAFSAKQPFLSPKTLDVALLYGPQIGGIENGNGYFSTIGATNLYGTNVYGVTQITTPILKLGTPSTHKQLYLAGDNVTIQSSARFIPDTDNSYDLGYTDSSLRWRDIFLSRNLVSGTTVRTPATYSTNVYATTVTTGTVLLGNTATNKALYLANDGVSIQAASRFIPDTDASYDLGYTDSSLRWRDVFLSRNLVSGATVRTPATYSTNVYSTGVTAGTVYIGTTGVNKALYLSGDNSAIQSSARFVPDTDGAYNLGYSATQLRWLNGFFTSTVQAPTHVIGDSGAPTITSGSGVPSSSQPNGSLFLRTDGTGPNLYVRENGAWVAK